MMDRRRFLGVGAMGVLGACATTPFFRRSLDAAAMGNGTKKMLLIFLRGGVDGVSALIPRGDSSYNDTDEARPNLFVPELDAIDLGNGFAQAHPALQVMVDEVPSTDLAWIHRVAYAGQSRSHFASQKFWENANPGFQTDEGWVWRFVQEHPELGGEALAGVSVSDHLQTLFAGAPPLAHIPDLRSYSLEGSDAELKLIGAAPGNGALGSGLLGVYGRSADSIRLDGTVRAVGQSMVSSLAAVDESGVDPDTYVPARDRAGGLPERTGHLALLPAASRCGATPEGDRLSCGGSRARRLRHPLPPAAATSAAPLGLRTRDGVGLPRYR